MTSNARDAGAGLRARARALVEDKRFDATIITLIVANAITLGLQASPTALAAWGPWLRAFDHAVLTVFVIELLLRFFVMRGSFFRDPWRLFDLVVVVIALLPATGALGVLRALRVLRVLRLISVVPAMRGVVSALLSALPGMGSIVGLMTLVLYVSAVIATELYGTVAPALFGSLGRTLFTLFQIMTVEGWPDIARDIMVQSPYAWLFFVPYLLIATFMVLNLFIAVVVNAMQSQFAEDQKGEDDARARLILDEITALRAQIQSLRATGAP